MTQDFDVIGDIHGHADHLEELLRKLGYTKRNGTYFHSERKALFVGDYIDRGPAIPETLRIVRSMVEEGSAIALMGNHEYNAICFHTHHPCGGHLRPHTIKNFKQHSETLLQFQNRQTEYDDYLEWFTTLPLWYEDEHIRAVHACWDTRHITRLSTLMADNNLAEDQIVTSSQNGTTLYDLVDVTLKGKEMAMPLGKHFYDKDGHKRTHIRIKWWLDTARSSYRDMSIIPLDDKLPDTAVKDSDGYYYRKEEKPVFFGHYWLQGEPNLYRGNVCCLDWSVAKGGVLAAYRYDGEKELSNSKFVYV